MRMGHSNSLDEVELNEPYAIPPHLDKDMRQEKRKKRRVLTKHHMVTYPR
jgi:hypothetical protein